MQRIQPLVRVLRVSRNCYRDNEGVEAVQKDRQVDRTLIVNLLCEELN
jgi:hypothetical protein